MYRVVFTVCIFVLNYYKKVYIKTFTKKIYYAKIPVYCILIIVEKEVNEKNSNKEDLI